MESKKDGPCAIQEPSLSCVISFFTVSLTIGTTLFNKVLYYFKDYALPAMRKYKIEKITVDICQKHVNDWSRKLKMYREVKAYTSKVLDFAIKRGYIQNNPMKLVDLPVIKKEIDVEEVPENFYSKEELVEFLTCLEKEDRYNRYAFFRLLAFSGMRMGEALALTWEDINTKDNEIRISKALSRGLDARQYVKSTKSGVSRTIKMDEKTIAVLKEWRKRQQVEYLKLGHNTLQTKQLVFSNTKNSYLQPSTIRKWIVGIQEKYNLSIITTHGLRHTHCSLLFEAGASIKEVQDRLGHSDALITMNIYAHVTKKAKEEAIQKFEKYLEL
ncbi:tyrosine-type recombinase/integrase [Lysinibacillus sp. LZ02]|uniref:tyrosine-type recombinase/integrase n=1 Tax=Lysinibacillus sp. LZ02 TaxID=3420668 RepID=UPI003D361268